MRRPHPLGRLAEALRVQPCEGPGLVAADAGGGGEEAIRQAGGLAGAAAALRVARERAPKQCREGDLGCPLEEENSRPDREERLRYLPT